MKRFHSIRSSDDFTKNDIGLEKLDSICMQLINIGEALKQIDKLTEAKLLVKYHEIDWKKAKGMRDIITHQSQPLGGLIIGRRPCKYEDPHEIVLPIEVNSPQYGNMLERYARFLHVTH